MSGGTIRLEVTPSFYWWDSRFGERSEGGSLVRGREPLGFDLTRNDVGTSMVPSLAPFEARVRDVLQDDDFSLDLGLSVTSWSHSQTRIPIRLDIGVTDWLTVSGVVPMVRSEAQVDVSFLGDSATANVGVNPAQDDLGSVSGFLTALGMDVDSFAATAAAICENQGPTSPECVDAQAVLAQGQSLDGGLSDLYEDGDAFFPLSGTDAGRAVEARVDDFRARLEAYGQAATFGAPPLSTTPLDNAGFEAIVTDPAYGVVGAPLIPVVGTWGMGDVELSVAARLLERRGDPGATDPGLRYQVGGEATLRLGTGIQADPDVFQSLPSGGRPGLGLRVFGSALAGRWGLRAHAALGLRQTVDAVRRVAEPDVILAPVAARTPVRWTPGKTVDLYAAPRFHLSEGLALTVPYRFLRKASDRYTLPDGSTGPPAGAPAGTPDVTVLEEETSVTLHRIGVGVVYSTLPAFRRDQSSYPIELRATWLTSFAGSGGRTPVLNSVAVTFRLYLSFWGGGA